MNRKTSRPSERQPRRSFSFEALEPRTMMSATTKVITVQGSVAPPTGPVAMPAVTAASAVATQKVTSTGPFTPAQIRSIYGFDKLSLTGAGTTIAIIEAYSDPTLIHDLHVFDQQFGLSDPSVSIAQELDGNNNVPRADTGWSVETDLDVEWAHAIAPGANILVCEATDPTSVYDMVDYARSAPGVSVVSMSFGAPEFEQSWNPASWFSANQTDFDSGTFTTPQGHRPVTFVASAGDIGSRVEYPSSSPNVLAVGGTVITAYQGNITTVGLATAGSSNAAPGVTFGPSNFQPMSYDTETAWKNGGGGFSGVESRPAYQNGFNSNSMRSVPDVAYGATNFWVFDSADGWEALNGTSAGAPQWAGLIALANQGRANLGGDALANTMADIYQLPASDFHDITTGSTGIYAATVGFDQATGRGTPIANLLVNDLIHSEYIPPPPKPLPIGSGGLPVNGTTTVSKAVVTNVTTSPTTPTKTTSATAHIAGVAVSPFVSRIGHSARATTLRASDAADRLFDALFGADGRLS